VQLNQAEKARSAELGLRLGDKVVFGQTREWLSTIVELPASIDDGSYAIDAVGAYTYLGGGGSQFDHVAVIGRFCSIATGVIAGLPEHPAHFLSAHPLFEGAAGWAAEPEFRSSNSAAINKAQGLLYRWRQERFGKIEIGHDVWIGEGAFIRRGVKIGNGAVVGARAVVMKDVPPYAIVAGTPARVVRFRFDPDTIAALEELEWWHYGLSAIDGVDFTDAEAAIPMIKRNIETGRAAPLSPQMLCLVRDEEPTVASADLATGDWKRVPLV
jgi:acetyltransferase-like isoleucine patch superfamily enzyme